MQTPFTRCTRGRQMAGLGIAMPGASAYKPQMDALAAQFAQMQRDIQANNLLIVEQSQAGLDMRDAGAANLDAQNKLNDGVDKLNTLYRVLLGTVAPGLSGALGQWPAVISVATVAAAIAFLTYEIVPVILAAINRARDLANAQAQAQAQTNIAQAQTALTAAIASGDPVQIAQAQANFDSTTAAAQAAGVTGTSITTWLSDNWQWLALGVGGFFVVREVIS